MDEDRFYKQSTLPTLVDEGENFPTLPEKIGPYKIEMLLSKGGMSLLYLGQDRKTREPRAIKVLSPAYVNHPEMVDHFLWEAKIIALASHPNIVKVYDHGKWEDGLYIAMEFIRGISLSQFITQQSFSLKRTLGIVLQIAYALCHLHTHGIIHRDLKPENILIAEDGEVKVIDFGISQLHEDNANPKTPSRNPSGQLMGTPNYMSPEQREHPHQISFSSDIYSLGVIAYELITGKLSYGVINLSLLPKNLQKIIGKALAVSIKERYQDIVDLITDLTHYTTSGELENDRTASDRTVETFELIERADFALSPAEVPGWQKFEIGLARHRNPHQFGLYVDFFKCANNTHLILIAQTFSTGPSAPIALGVLKGMIRAYIHPKLEKANDVFVPKDLAQSLATLIAEEKLKERFLLSVLKLVPYTDTLIFLSCGLGPLLHLPQGSHTVRSLNSQNPLLGSTPIPPLFTETADNWREGDLLVLHSFDVQQMQEGSQLMLTTKKATQESALLSPMRSAEKILKSAITTKSLERHPQALLTIQRLG